MKYLKYLIRHKWYVFVECCKIGRPITGILHDWTKFLPDEFIPYVRYFYGKNIKKIDFYEPGLHNDFDRAWLKHIHRNPHHWQYWVLREDEGEVKTIAIPHKYREEMICDWEGARKAQDKKHSTKEWYLKNKHRMKFHLETEKWIEQNI